MMVGGIIALAVLALGLLWLLRGDSSRQPRTPGPADDWDQAELEEAEREVRDRSSGTRPDDEEPGDDWGPGTGGKPVGR
jgi:hypothetical protein